MDGSKPTPQHLWLQRVVGDWTYESEAEMSPGKLDTATDTLTLDTEGPSMTQKGKLTKYRETIVVKSDDKRTFSSSMLGDDGQWMTFITATYKRVTSARVK